MQLMEGNMTGDPPDGKTKPPKSGGTDSNNSDFDPHRYYTVEALAKAWPCDKVYVTILIKCGLRALRPSPKTAQRILGQDWIDFLNQLADAEGRTNELNYPEYEKTHKERKKRSA